MTTKSHEDYTVGWICPLEVEQTAALEMLDEEHEHLPKPPTDHNVYSLEVSAVITLSSPGCINQVTTRWLRLLPK